MTFGLGDIAAGITNTPMTYIARLGQLITGGEGGDMRDKATGEKIDTDRGTLNPFKLYKEGRADFVRDQNEFKEAHPNLNLAGELGGAILPALFSGGASAAASGAKGAGGLAGLLAKMGKGAITGGKVGAAYGAGSGLTENPDELSYGGAVKGTGQGLVLGGLFGGGMPVAGAALKPFAKPILGAGKSIFELFRHGPQAWNAGRAYNRVAKAAGADINKAIDSGSPLLDISNEKVARIGKIAKRADETAGDIMDAALERGYSAQGGKLRGIVDKYSPNTAIQTAEEFAAQKAGLSRSAYEPLERLGALSKLDRGVAEAVNGNPQIQQAIAIAKRNVPQLQKLPGTDFRVLNEAKKILDRAGRPNPNAAGHQQTQIYYANQARGALVDAMDNATGGAYKKVLGEYGDILSADRALSAGRELLNMNPDLAARAYQQAGKAEREAMRIGLADALRTQIGKSTVDGSTRNVASNLVGSEQNRAIFKAVLGKDANAFIGELQGVNRATRNYGIVGRGSDTAENLNRMGSAGVRFIKNPMRATLGAVGRGIDKITGLDQAQVARLLTDPKYLAQIQRNLSNWNIHAARGVGHGNFNALRAAGPLARQGQPSARVSGKGWDKIKESPNPETYGAIPTVRDVYSTGDYHGPTPTNKPRRDNIKQWHWFQKRANGGRTVGVQVGEDENGRLLYNVNPNVKKPLVSPVSNRAPRANTDNPSIRQPSLGTGSNLSIADIFAPVKPVNLAEIAEILKTPYAGGMLGGITGSQRRKK
jgi:hypothetical protein